MKTPARTSVTPVRSRAKCAVGVEPTLTTGAAWPWARNRSAAATAAAALRLGRFGKSLAVAAGIRLARVSQHAAKLHAALSQRVGNFHDTRVVGSQPAAVTIAVDLDQNRGLRPAVAHRVDDGSRLLHGVEDRRDVDAARDERPQPRELVRRETDRVSDVLEPAIGEILRLLERRDRDWSAARREQPLRDLDRLRSLHVGPEAHVQGLQARRQPRDVALHLGEVEHQGGRLEGVEHHAGRWMA